MFYSRFQLLRPAFSTGTKYFKDNKLTNLQLCADDKLQSLHKLTGIFSKHRANMTYIKTHLEDFKADLKKQYTLLLSVKNVSDSRLSDLIIDLDKIGVHATVTNPIQVPWFPKQMNDINLLGKTLLEVNQEANNDHLQFTDIEYRKRRDHIAQIAKQYKMGEKIPKVQYSEEENDLWVRIFQKLRGLHKGTMSDRFQYQMDRLNNYFKLNQKIPQLNDLSMYLQSQSGFIIKPVHGILSQREFLNAFAFKVFNCTQYLRHTKTPDYTPEPDIVHEIIGHIPMFADPAVADLSQKIGIISLGATDEEIAKLGALYWYTLQFGGCKQDGKHKGYGAGIASSIGQIQHFISGNAKFKPFQPLIDCDMPYPIQTVQETYRITQSFQKSLEDLSQYGKCILKPISTTYNHVTKEIDYDRNITAVFKQDKGPQF